MNGGYRLYLWSAYQNPSQSTYRVEKNYFSENVWDDKTEHRMDRGWEAK